MNKTRDSESDVKTGEDGSDNGTVDGRGWH